MKYYNLEDTLSRNADIMFIIGHRSAGKTYAFKEWALKSWIQTGKQWGYIRRTQDEINAIKTTLWDDIAFKYGYAVKARGSVALIRKIQPQELEGKELKQWSSENPWQPFGYYFALSEQQMYKSSSFVSVDKLCYDEIILENLRKFYLPDEVNQLNSLIFTIGRDRRIRTVCLSNAGFLANPFFEYYNITSREFESAEFIRRNNGNVLFHYFKGSEENIEELEKSTVGKISNKEYKKYAFSNKFQDAYSDLIAVKPKKAVAKLAVASRSGIFTIFEDDDIWFIEKGSKHQDIVTLDPSYIKEGVIAVPSFRSVFQTRLNARMVRFASPEARSLFLSCL